MTTPSAPDLTRLLLSWRDGDREALTALVPLVYSELRRIAHARMRAESPDRRTIQTTDLVHDAFLRLSGGAPIDWHSRAHFFAVSARLMRRILVDRARSRRSLARGGRAEAVELADWGGSVPAKSEDLIALDEALERLAKADERKGRVVELRYFGGLSVEETAEVLHVTTKTVTRDWKVARLWLLNELQKSA